MRSSTTSVHKYPPNNRSYSPSVPLSVYRELATELQAAQAMLDTLNAKNQQLAKQNQQLRQEIEKVAQHILYLQQIADVTVVDKVDIYHSEQDLKFKPSRPLKSTRSIRQASQSQVAAPSPFPAGTVGAGFSKNVFMQVEADSYRRRYKSESAAEMSGWKLAIAILIVTATAFSTGYLLVRPLLSSR